MRAARSFKRRDESLHMKDTEQALEYLVARLKASRAISSDRLERAFLEVPRHVFLPHVRTRIAYEDRAVVVKDDDHGVPLSSASQPTMVAEMLGQLCVEEGARVLEVGTGTGYDAALLLELVGASGSVVSVEIDGDLAEAARENLDRSGHGRVEVVIGDGRLGYAPRAPYDRIIVTGGAHEIAEAWRDQLADGGRLVVPLVDAWGLGVSVAFEKCGSQLLRQDEVPCAFIVLRSE